MEREGKGEKYQCGKEASVGYLLYTPRQETKPTTQTCALTGTRDFLVYEMTLQPTEPHWPGEKQFLYRPGMAVSSKELEILPR